MVLGPQVEHAAVEHAQRVEAEHARQAELAERRGGDVLLRDHALHVFGAGRGEAQRVLAGGAALGAVGEIGAEREAAQRARIEASAKVEAHRAQVVLDLEVLQVARLGALPAPATRVEHAQGGGVGVVAAEREVEEACRVVGQVDRVAAAVGQAGVDLEDALLALGRRMADVGADRPVLVDRQLVVPAEGEQAVVGGVVVVAHHDRLHVGPVRLDHGVVRAARAAHKRAAVPPDQAHLQAALGLFLVEPRIEHVDDGVVLVVGLEFDHAHQAVALVVAFDQVHVGAAEHAVVVAPGLELPALCRVVHARVADRHADRAVGELVDVRRTDAAAPLVAVAQAVHVAARVERHRALAEGQGPHGAQVDRARQALAHQPRVGRLVDDHLVDQLRRVLVELDAAVVAQAHLFAAVEQRRGEVAREAADVDLLRTVAEALRGQAGQARQRVGDRHVRQLADVLGRDRLDDGGGRALGVDRVLDATADARDLDTVEGDGVGLWRVRLLGRRGGLRVRRARRQVHRRRQRHGQQVALEIQHGPLSLHCELVAARAWNRAVAAPVLRLEAPPPACIDGRGAMTCGTCTANVFMALHCSRRLRCHGGVE